MNARLLPALEDRLSEKKLCKDASNRPNIDSGGLNVPENERQNFLNQ